MKRIYTKPKLTKHTYLKNITFSEHERYDYTDRDDYANTILHGQSMTTILEAIHTYHHIVCGICSAYFNLSAANYTRFEAARILNDLGWQVVNETVLCPDCYVSWNQFNKEE